MNARGQKLKQIELLKNHVLKYLEPREEDFIDQARQKWNEVVSRLDVLPDSDDFVNHFAKVYIKRRPDNRSETYRLIKEEVPISTLGEFLDAIVDFSSLYCDLIGSNNTAVRYFTIKNNKQVRPLIVATERLVRHKIIQPETRDSAFRMLRNYFFQFNVARLSSNKTDEAITQAAYDVYHCKHEVQFKYLLTGLFIKLDKYLNSSIVENNLYSNTSLQYSNKRGAQRTAKLVRYVLLEYCSFFQTDTAINPEKINIEHLQVDSGDYETSQLWNLTLTTPEINQRELATKDAATKAKLLSDLSTIRVNQKLISYVHDSRFDFEARKRDMLQTLLSDVFCFSATPFAISEQEYIDFLRIEGIVKSDEKLLQTLYTLGKNFIVRLSNDPKMRDLNERYRELESAGT